MAHYTGIVQNDLSNLFKVGGGGGTAPSLPDNYKVIEFTTSADTDGVVTVNFDSKEIPNILVPLNIGTEGEPSLTYALYTPAMNNASIWVLVGENTFYSLDFTEESGETGICEVNSTNFKFRSHGDNTVNISTKAYIFY